MSNIIERSFKTNLQIMTFMGILPSKRNNKLIKIRGVLLYVACLVLPVLLSFIKLLSMDTKSQSVEMNFTVIYIAEAAGATFKLLPLLKNERHLDKCVNYFAHPRFHPKNDEERKITEECIRVCRRIGNVYLYGILLGTFVWNLQAIVTEGNQLPLNLWLPFDATSNSIIYYAMVILLVPVDTYGALATTFLDPLIGSLAYHATCQLKILQHKLQTMDRDINTNLEDDDIISFDKMYKNLKECVRLYKDIFSFVAEFEDCISWPVFCQIAASIFTMCFGCIGLIMSSGAKNVDTILNILATFTPLFQSICYCYFGSLLYTESRNVPDAIYMGPWYQCDVRIRKILILIMERSKKPLIITSGKIVQLTLETFTSILKTSYSLIAVFNNYE